MADVDEQRLSPLAQTTRGATGDRGIERRESRLGATNSSQLHPWALGAPEGGPYL